MSNCVRCGAETIMYIEGVPVCVDCDNAAKGKQRSQSQLQADEAVGAQTIYPASTNVTSTPNRPPGNGPSASARRLPSLLVVSERR